MKDLAELMDLHMELGGLQFKGSKERLLDLVRKYPEKAGELYKHSAKKDLERKKQEYWAKRKEELGLDDEPLDEDEVAQYKAMRDEIATAAKAGQKFPGYEEHGPDWWDRFYHMHQKMQEGDVEGEEEEPDENLNEALDKWQEERGGAPTSRRKKKPKAKPTIEELEEAPSESEKPQTERSEEEPEKEEEEEEGPEEEEPEKEKKLEAPALKAVQKVLTTQKNVKMQDSEGKTHELHPDPKKRVQNGKVVLKDGSEVEPAELHRLVDPDGKLIWYNPESKGNEKLHEKKEKEGPEKTKWREESSKIGEELFRKFVDDPKNLFQEGFNKNKIKWDSIEDERKKEQIKKTWLRQNAGNIQKETARRMKERQKKVARLLTGEFLTLTTQERMAKYEEMVELWYCIRYHSEASAERFAQMVGAVARQDKLDWRYFTNTTGLRFSQVEGKIAEWTR